MALAIPVHVAYWEFIREYSLPMQINLLFDSQDKTVKFQYRLPHRNYTLCFMPLIVQTWMK